jgi:hypothetical protein
MPDLATESGQPKWTNQKLKYKPLSIESRDIRLLTLLPPENAKHGDEVCSVLGDLVRLRLENVSLDDYNRDFELDYEAFTATIKQYVDANIAPQVGAVNEKFTSHLTKKLWFAERGMDAPEELMLMPTMGYEQPKDTPSLTEEDSTPRLKTADNVGPLDNFDPSKHGRFVWGDFIALSYTWGNANDAREIIVNGCVVNVTKNLEAALRVLRCRNEYRAGVKLWVDALCINQEDLEERAAQVSQMSDIYSLAVNVNVWLDGLADVKSLSVAHTILRSLPKAQLALTPYALAASDSNREPFSNAYFDLFTLPYWSRAWILQELVLSPWWTTFICQSESFTWKFIFDLHFIFRGAGSKSFIDDWKDKDLSKHGLSFATWLKRVQEVLNMVNFAFFPGRDSKDESKLGRTLALLRYSNLSDVRDRVYALLGMIPSEISSKITPNYNLDAEAIYADFSRAIAEATGSLEQLFFSCLPHMRPENPILPSWAINLQEPGDFSIDTWLTDTVASWPCKPLFHFQREGTVLVCRGFLVDVVHEIAHWDKEIKPSQSTSSPESVYPDEASLKSALLHIFRGDPTYDSGGKMTWFDIPWFEGTKPEPAVLEELAQQGWSEIIENGFVAQFLKYRTTLRNWNMFGRTFESLFPREIAKCNDSTAFRKNIKWTARSLISCKSGRLGAVSTHVQPGDSIYIFPGCRWPIVLRQNGAENEYEVVGLSFVDGLMLGEPLKMLVSEEGVRFVDVQIV